MSIDLNADLGESFGAWSLGHDEALLACVTSANVACGFHAGDPSVMARTVDMALAKGVAIGAHPGYPDLQGFGRRSMGLSPKEVHDSVLYQIGALEAFLRARGGVLNHVKPHGALYNAAATDGSLAEAIAAAVRAFDAGLVLVGLAGSALTMAGERLGLVTAHEAFLDRSYEADGTLTPRNVPGAVLSGEEDIVARAVRMVRLGRVRARTGTEVCLRADTLCLHGDGAEPAALAAELHAAMRTEGVDLAPVRRKESA